MAQIVYRGNISAKSFPFLSENFGRSVIVPGPDQAFNRQLYASADDDKNIGIPQFYYAHNVMPTPEGIQSVGYSVLVNGIQSNMIHIDLLQNIAGEKIYLGRTGAGDFYVLQGGIWVPKGSYPGQVTFAFVAGITYVYVAGIGCMYYDFSTNAFVPVVLAGLNVTGVDAVRGICAAAGYMIAWTYNFVAWSSLVDPTDFVPSLITGAGGGAVEGAKGKVNFCVPNLLGFVVYTDSNAVAALYSGNARYPFNFREIVSSGGLDSLDLIAMDSQSGNHYAYTTSGLQLVSSSVATVIYPEITDFVSGLIFEDFDTSTNLFTRQVLLSTMRKRINVISDRYFVISYGVQALTHAIVLDLAQKRYGKLKITHTKAFEFQLPSVEIRETPRQSIGFLQQDGTIRILQFNVNFPAQGVLVLGKYQYVRSRLLTLDLIELEDVEPGTDFQVVLQTAIDGKNFYNTTPAPILAAGELRKYGTNETGRNHSIVCKGQFHLNTVQLTFHTNGRD